MQLSGAHHTCPKQLCATQVRGKAAAPAQAPPSRAMHMPATQTLLPALPLISSNTSIPHLKPQHFTFCPFPPAPLSHTGLFQVGSSKLCPDAPSQRGPCEARNTPKRSNKSRNLLSGCCGFSSPAEWPWLPGKESAATPRSSLILPAQPEQHLPAAVLPHHCTFNLQ